LPRRRSPKFPPTRAKLKKKKKKKKKKKIKKKNLQKKIKFDMLSSLLFFTLPPPLPSLPSHLSSPPSTNYSRRSSSKS
jgi:hypothetical protein